MWLHEICEQITNSPLLGIFIFAVALAHFKIVNQTWQESKKGNLPGAVAHAYLSTLITAVAGILKSPLSSPNHPPSLFWSTAGIFLTLTIPIFILVLVSQKVALPQNLIRINRFLILAYAFLTLLTCSRIQMF